MNSGNKKYIIIFAGVIVILIMFASILFLQQSSPKQPVSVSPPSSSNSAASNKNMRVIVPTISLAPLANNAKDAARQFYLYYISSPKNPLANGAFRANPYLSPEFKDTIADAYHNGNISIFCSQNESSNIVVGKEQQEYYNNGYLTEEVISQAPPGTKDLYNVLLQQVNGKWTIFDINCL